MKSILVINVEIATKFILLINVKMPTIVGILTFISKINTASDRGDPGFLDRGFKFDSLSPVFKYLMKMK